MRDGSRITDMKRYGFCINRLDKPRFIWTKTHLANELFELGIISDSDIRLVNEWWVVESYGDDYEDAISCLNEEINKLHIIINGYKELLEDNDERNSGGLLPCPFCGSEDIVTASNGTHFFVRCEECKVTSDCYNFESAARLVGIYGVKDRSCLI